MRKDSESQSDSDARSEPRLSRQFSVLSLLALTTVSAAVLALVRPLKLPSHVKLLFAGYAITMAAYVLLRGVGLIRKSLRLRRSVAGRRRELEAWLDEKRQRP